MAEGSVAEVKEALAQADYLADEPAARVAFFVSVSPAARSRNCVLSSNLIADSSPLSVFRANDFAAVSTFSMVPLISVPGAAGSGGIQLYLPWRIRTIGAQRTSVRTTEVVIQEQMTNQQVKPKVLVADDERVIADTLAIILNQSGFDATAVYNGEKAVEAARTLRPDMLISDVIMTDMNGIDAAITIRTMLPNCKILLFSGQAATADLLENARTKGYEFEILAKPVHPQDLLTKLRG